MITLIVYLVKFLVFGVKADVIVSGWDGVLEQITALLKMINSKGEEAGE